ncbi:hypothetical protein [Carboxylicivirga caseinilyticus]|uniref:hypothetical protein n=1 Tax=Carboxylicivirga caseinilyticus TaxID=3417572 RepID=UPI003D341842|nr:hypothetical protein [Marinilabiliaceae bacterium A049]
MKRENINILRYKNPKLTNLKHYLKELNIMEPHIESLIVQANNLNNLCLFYTNHINDEGVMMKGVRGVKQNPSVTALEKAIRELNALLVEISNLISNR